MPWQAPSDVVSLVNEVRRKYHHHLEQAEIAVGFLDSKPFIKNKFNWGKVRKFTKAAKLWHPDDKKYDFEIMFCAEAWHGILNLTQREAWADLLLCRCSVELEPVVVVENKKKKVVKDEWGRVEYSNEFKLDEDGRPKWKVLPFDVEVLASNIKRYGLWLEPFSSLKYAIERGTKEESISYDSSIPTTEAF